MGTPATSPPPPKSPISTEPLATSCTNLQNTAFDSPSNSSTTGNSFSNTATPFSKIAVSPQFDTLYEKSHDSMFESTINDLDVTGSSSKRKRKSSPENESVLYKRKRDLSYSERSRKKISEFFKTPINYFTNRRRTIGAVNKTLNESVMSSSGIFDVNVVENLDKLDGSVMSKGDKKGRRSLFSRAFSSSKSKRDKKRTALNAKRLSFGDSSECDGSENFNSSCFPAIPSYPTSDPEPWQLKEREHPGPLISHAVVLTSFHYNSRVRLKCRLATFQACTSRQRIVLNELKLYFNFIGLSFQAVSHCNSLTALFIVFCSSSF